MNATVIRYGAAVAGAAVVSLVTVSAAPQYGDNTSAARNPPQNVQTPRTPDGHPDLSGVWGGRGGGGGAALDDNGNLTVLTQQRPCSQQQVDLGACAPAVNFERDSGVRQRMGPLPQYKPEFWERVQYLDRNGTIEDPEFHCRPAGVPRMGPPNKIVQTPKELILLYQRHNEFRVVPIDGRPHDKVRAIDSTWYGDAVGRWEGDTLVVDIVGFNGESWLGWPGWFHSNNMHVVERFTRTGNRLTWSATVEDPDVLLEPFEIGPRTIALNPNPDALLQEDLPCEERDAEHMVTHERG